MQIVNQRNPPYHAPAKPVNSNPGGSPGLLTSTGGLYGSAGMLVVPFFNNITNRYYAASFDPTNFDCEEASIYNFKMEDGNVPERAVTIHQVLITYKQLGSFSFYVGLNAYTLPDDKHISVEKKIIIKAPIPTNKLHTIKVGNVAGKPFQITGLRPQLYIRRDPNSGPFSIIRIVMAGNGDEKEQL